MNNKSCSYTSIIKASGIYDILVMIPFALPGVVELTIMYISHIHNSLSLAGSIPEFSSFHFLFINIMAIVSIVWAVIRVKTPIPLFAWYDTAARTLIASTMLVYLVSYQVTEILWLFFVAEVAWAAFQLNACLFKYEKNSSVNVQFLVNSTNHR